MHRRLLLDELIQDLRIGLRGLLRAPAADADDRRDGRPRHRRDDGDLRRGERGAAAAAAVRAIPAGSCASTRTRRRTGSASRSPTTWRSQAQQTQFEQIAGYTDRAMAFSDGEVGRAPDRAARVLELLRSARHHARRSDATSPKPTAGPAARARSSSVTSFWQQRLGGRADAIGKPIRTRRRGLHAGRRPAADGRTARTRARTSSSPRSGRTPPRKGPFFITVARAACGTGIESRSAAAASELRAINRRLFPIWKVSYQDDKATWSMVDLKTHVVGDVAADRRAWRSRRSALVWLIACANASNLLIARVTQPAARARACARRSAPRAGASSDTCWRKARVLAIGAASPSDVALARSGVAPAARAGRRLLPAHRTRSRSTGRLAGCCSRLTLASAPALRPGAGAARHRRPGRRGAAVVRAFLDRQRQRAAAAADSRRQRSSRSRRRCSSSPGCCS